MATRHVITSPLLPPPPSSEADVVHVLRDLITQLQVVLAERGVVLNSLVDGYFNQLHGEVQTLQYAAAAVENQLPLSAGVFFVTVTALGAGVTINGIASDSAPGRFICLANTSFVDNWAVNNESVLAAAADRIHCNAATVTILPRRSILFWRWAGNLIFPEGRWMRMTT